MEPHLEEYRLEGQLSGLARCVLCALQSAAALHSSLRHIVPDHNLQLAVDLLKRHMRACNRCKLAVLLLNTGSVRPEPSRSWCMTECCTVIPGTTCIISLMLTRNPHPDSTMVLQVCDDSAAFASHQCWGSLSPLLFSLLWLCALTSGNLSLIHTADSTRGKLASTSILGSCARSWQLHACPGQHRSCQRHARLASDLVSTGQACRAVNCQWHRLRAARAVRASYCCSCSSRRQLKSRACMLAGA